jgi:hypothetical protein
MSKDVLVSNALLMPLFPEERARAQKKLAQQPERTRIAALSGVDPIVGVVHEERKGKILAALSALDPEIRKMLRVLHGDDPVAQYNGWAKAQERAEKRRTIALAQDTAEAGRLALARGNR